MTQSQAFGEIIESSLTAWTGQTWRWDNFPNFGSLVIIDQPPYTLIGLIYQVNTGSSEAGRTPYAYQQTHEELLKTQPHIFDFLKTTFHCMALGYQKDITIIYQIPPCPPKIHSFISSPSLSFYKHFIQNERYVHMLFSLPMVNHDELFLALLRTCKEHNILSQEHIVQSAETFCLLTGNDYKRLKTFLYRAQALIE